MEEADVYNDENEPKYGAIGTMYCVHSERREAVAYLVVEEGGYTELWDWRWFGKRDPHRSYKLTVPEDRELWDAMREVWSWLREWEYVELKPIGPDDTEYFATKKLTGEESGS
jgi:hypothetical protein